MRSVRLAPLMERATLAGVVWVVQDLTVRDSKAGAVSTFLGIVIAAVSVFTLAVVAWAFIWAARKDGEEDRAVQKRLGIRRRTRLGR
jgi:hypothetical protein